MKKLLLCLVLVACGGNHNNGNGADASGSGGPGDGSGSNGGSGSGACTPGGAQCSNCVDDDGDGKVDGFDPECTGAADNDEGSFATGIPGDNIDAVDQDCFFDGNSGAGNDGCNQHVCCLLGAQTQAECQTDIQGIVNNPAETASHYDKTQCYQPLGTVAVPQQCQDVCAPLAPPGCDCFGCCLICDPDNPTSCATVDLNPAVSPDCTTATLNDPTKCKPCTQNTECGSTTCGGDTCILCPGQDPDTLPPECNGTTACPSGETTCTGDADCGAGSYCANGCCIGIVQ